MCLLRISISSIPYKKCSISFSLSFYQSLQLFAYGTMQYTNGLKKVISILIMDDSKNFCQNCGFELDEGLTVCKRCNLVAALNLENFLLSKYKLLAIIGIFGALSVYLSTTASTHGNNPLLQYGSYISLAIVILLSLICGWDLVQYSFKILQFPFDEKFHYWAWLKLGFRFSTILLFISFFASVILLISLYILSDITVAQPLIYSIVLDFIILLIITTIYYPYRSMIEMRGTIFRLILNFLLIGALVFSIKQLSVETPDKLLNIISISFFIILSLFLIVRSSMLIFQTMNTGTRSLTIDNLKKKLRLLWKH